MMRQDGLKLGRIDSSSSEAQAGKRRDGEREEKYKCLKEGCNEVEKAECWKERCVRCHLRVFVSVCEPLLRWVLRGCLFSRTRFHFLSLQASASSTAPSNPLPPGLVEQRPDMSLFLCKSNWRQAFFGMTWRWVAKSFQPSLLRIIWTLLKLLLHTAAAHSCSSCSHRGMLTSYAVRGVVRWQSKLNPPVTKGLNHATAPDTSLALMFRFTV